MSQSPVGPDWNRLPDVAIAKLSHRRFTDGYTQAVVVRHPRGPRWSVCLGSDHGASRRARQDQGHGRDGWQGAQRSGWLEPSASSTGRTAAKDAPNPGGHSTVENRDRPVPPTQVPDDPGQNPYTPLPDRLPSPSGINPDAPLK